MIRKSGLLVFTMAVMLMTSACGTILPDTSEIKVIVKPNSPDAGNQKSDLEVKGEILQAETEDQIKSVIGERAAKAIQALRDFDMEALSIMVHPEKGVRFTPYAYVNVDSDLVFSADKIKNISADSTLYTWGSYDGSGEPIKLAFKDYYKSFIYDADFSNAKETGYNKALGKGNTTNNSVEVYKNSIIVEYHFPGFDPKYEGMDWRSLRLVFEKFNDQWYLVGIIHDQWTV